MAIDKQVVSWVTMLVQTAPADDWVDLRHDDEEASELHRLRGLALSQASETEAALAEVLAILDPGAKRDRPAGVLLNSIKALLSDEVKADAAGSLHMLEEAVRRRNRLAHDRIEIGSSELQGRYVPVIALLGLREISAEDLRQEFAMQRQGTQASVVLLLTVDEWRRRIFDE